MHAHRTGGVGDNTGMFEEKHCTNMNMGRWTLALEGLLQQNLPSEVLSAFTATAMEVLLYQPIPLHLWRETELVPCRCKKCHLRRMLDATFMTGFSSGWDNTLNPHFDVDGFWSVASVVRQDQDGTPMLY